MHNADPREAERQRRLAKALAYRRKEDWTWALSDARGRRVLFGIMEDLGLDARTPTGSMVETNLSIGKRNGALSVRDDVLTYKPSAMAAMRMEYEAEPPILGVDDDE